MYFVLQDPAKPEGTNEENSTKVKWVEVIKTRNVIIAMLALFCSMACIFVLSAMVPLYLENYIHLTSQQMGLVMSAIGFGGFAGQFALPGISDFVGRRIVAIVSFIGAAIFVWIFSGLGADTTWLFASLFLVSFFCLGNIALITGPISTESAPVGLVASAIGLVVGAGEIFGGGVAPLIGGYIAQHYGIENVIYQALVGVVLGAIVCLFLKETAPKRTMPTN